MSYTLQDLEAAAAVMKRVQEHLGREWRFTGCEDGYDFELDLAAYHELETPATEGRFELRRTQGIAATWTLRWYELDAEEPRLTGTGDSPTKAYYNLLDQCERSDDPELRRWAASVI